MSSLSSPLPPQLLAALPPSCVWQGSLTSPSLATHLQPSCFNTACTSYHQEISEDSARNSHKVKRMGVRQLLNHMECEHENAYMAICVFCEKLKEVHTIKSTLCYLFETRFRVKFTKNEIHFTNARSMLQRWIRQKLSHLSDDVPEIEIPKGTAINQNMKLEHMTALKTHINYILTLIYRTAMLGREKGKT